MNQLKELVTMVGRNRFVLLVTLAIITAALAGAWQKYFLPQQQQLTIEKDSVEQERMRLQTDIRELPAKYAVLKENESRYDALNANGFVGDQDRIIARTNMDGLRVQTGVRGVSYDISPQTTVSHPQEYALNMQIVKSQVKVDLKGISDLELRVFVEKIQKDFAGLVVARTVKLERGEAVDEGTLRRLGSKEPVDFAKATATFDWYNVIPKPVDPTSPEAQAFGGVQ